MKIRNYYILLFACAMLLPGCHSSRLQPTSETVQTLIVRDTLRDTIIRRDTLARFVEVYRHDSTATRQAGDTIFVERWHTSIERDSRSRAKETERTTSASSMMQATDTVRVRVPYPVERRLTRWERVKQDAGGLALGALAVVFVAAAVWLIRRIRGNI